MHAGYYSKITKKDQSCIPVLQTLRPSTAFDFVFYLSLELVRRLL
jgi:hypothetical protein